MIATLPALQGVGVVVSEYETATTNVPVQKFPLVPSAFWDNPNRKVEWTIENPNAQMWRAAVALGLERRVQGRTCYVLTTQEEIARVIIWAWDHPLSSRA